MPVGFYAPINDDFRYMVVMMYDSGHMRMMATKAEDGSDRLVVASPENLQHLQTIAERLLEEGTIAGYQIVKTIDGPQYASKFTRK